MRRITLRLRLFLSYVLVVAVGAAVAGLVVEVVGRRLFDSRMHGLGYGAGHRAGSGISDLQSAFGSAVTRALLLALAASLVAAALAATFVGRRLLRPVDAIRAATHRLAAGRFGESIPRPGEPELAALVDDVNAMAEALKTTEQRRAALIGDVAHEMRTPLTALKGYADGIADGIFSSEEVLPTMTAELGRLERLAADLAAVSRSEETASDLRARADDLGDIARTVADRLRPRYEGAHINLVVEVKSHIPVTVDRDRIVQALTNAVGNALAYTPAGGSVHVTAEARPDGKGSVIVADTGVGLAADDLERIFERFYRVDPHGHAGGSGVGLTIARSIARAHGGDLSVTSAGPGKGSRFEFVVPLSEVPPAALADHPR